MSLINNMLKDLETRETPKNALPPMALNSTTNSKPLSTKIAYVLILLFSLLILFFASLHYTANAPSTHAALPNEVAVVSTPFSTTVDSSWLKSAFINGVTVQIKDHVTELTFMLDHAALYRLAGNTNQRQLTLVIERTQLQSELPPVNYLNTAIDSISEKNINGDAYFTLALAPGATIKYVDLSNTENNPVLVVAIENPATTNEA